MSPRSRHRMRAAACCAVVLLTMPMIGAPLHAAETGEGALARLAILETVLAELDADGTPQQAELHTRLDARGRGDVELVDPTSVTGLRERGRLRAPATQSDAVVWDLDLTGETTTRRTVAEYPAGALPLSARIRYELDGEQVDAEELRGASGRAAIQLQLRNATSQPTGVTVGSGGDRRLEVVDLAVPLYAETRLHLDESWAELSSDAGRVGADRDGVTVAWSSALFEPFGSTVAELEISGEVHDASLPRVEVDATPVTTDSSDLLVAAEDLLTERAASDAVGAFLAATLADALGGVVDGATQLAGGLDELQAGVDESAPDLAGVDPEALAADAFADLGDGLGPAGLDDLLDPGALDAPALDPDALLGDLDAGLDPDDLLGELDPEALLGDLDAAALLADADFGALLELLLDDVLADLPALDLDPALVEGALAEVFDELGEQISLEELLANLDVAALLEGVDLDAALADALADVDLGSALSDLADQIDFDTVLADVDLDALLAELLGDLDLGLSDLNERLEEMLGEATVGDLLGDVDLDALVAVIAADGALEVEVAAAVAALLDQLDIELPTVGDAELEALGETLQATLATVASLAAAADQALEELDDAGSVEDLPIEDLADLADGLGQTLDEVGDELGGLAESLLEPIDAALVDADAGLTAARDAMETLEDELDEQQQAQLEPVKAAIATVDEAVAAARSGADEARGKLLAFDGELDELAARTAGLADALRDPSLADDVPGEVFEHATDAVAEVATGLETAEDELAALVAKVEGLASELDDGAALEDLLLEALADRQIDFEPIMLDGAERLLARLEDVRVSELLEAADLADLVAELGLDATLTDLLADLELDDLTELLEGADIDLAALLDDLDLDLATLLADVDLAALLDAFELADVDLAGLLDGLELDPADLLAGVDLAALFEDLDLAEVLGPTLEGLDFADIEQLLGEVDLDLAELLDAADLDPASLLAGVQPPDFTDLLPELDFDDLLADLELDPAALLADADLPGFEGLLDELDLDFDDLLAEAGLEDLGDLDQVIGGLLDALAGLAEGGDELAGGLSQLADEGLGQLVAQLDDEARSMELELATLSALEDRAADAQPTAAPQGIDPDASVRYQLRFDPSEPLAPGAAVLGALLAAAVAAEGLRRRWAGRAS